MSAKKVVLPCRLIVFGITCATRVCAQDDANAAVVKAREKARGLMREGAKLQDDALAKAKKGRYRDAMALAELSMEKLTAAYKSLQAQGIDKSSDSLARGIYKLQESASSLRYQFRKQVTMLDDDAYQSVVASKKKPTAANHAKKIAVPEDAGRAECIRRIAREYTANPHTKSPPGRWTRHTSRR